MSSKSFPAAFFWVLLIFAWTTAKPAEAKYASLVMDAKTGLVLHAVNAHTLNYPASLTKLMTLYMVFDALRAGDWTLNTRIKASRKATRQPPSRLAVRYGETITINQAIRALIVKSANDVAVMVAEAYAGSERKFALRMTAMARKIGMSRSTFRNASGLPHRGQLSTAHDMALLARRLMTDFPEYYGYFSETSFTFHGRTFPTHNKLMRSYEGADGLKTGYIHASGFNLVLSAHRDNQRLIGVVFGGNTAKQRNRHLASLMNKGFRSLGIGANAPQAAKARAQPNISEERPIAKNLPNGDDYGVQVGAYAKYDPAYESARKAFNLASRYLDDGMIRIVPLKRRKKGPLYRARILGVSKREAYRACRLLERKSIPCMELKITETMQLAFAGNEN